MQDIVYSHSSTQINLPGELSAEIIEWGRTHVPEADVYQDPTDPSFGRENEIHITILYGLRTDDPSQVSALLQDVKPLTCALGRISIFKTNSKFDVLKIDVQSP